MEYIDLDEYLIFESQAAFEDLWHEDKEGKEFLNLHPVFLRFYKNIPNVKDVKSQLLHNIEVIGDPQRYINELKTVYHRIFATNYILQLKNEEYNFRFSLNQMCEENNLPKHNFDRHRDDNNFYTENFDDADFTLKQDLNHIIGGLNNLKKLRFLAETIQDTINDAEQALKVEAEENELPTTDETKTDLRIQMLIIHYLRQLGYLKVNFHDKNKIAPLFSLLLGRNEQNIRTQLGYTKPQFMDKDLRMLLPLFESLGEQAKPVVENIKKNLERAENEPNNKPNRKKSLQS